MVYGVQLFSWCSTSAMIDARAVGSREVFTKDDAARFDDKKIRVLSLQFPATTKVGTEVALALIKYLLEAHEASKYFLV
jgi:hypothetical protein